MTIYIWKGDQQYGPYTEEQVREFMAAGNFTPEDQARRDNGRWQTLAELLPPVESAASGGFLPKIPPARSAFPWPIHLRHQNRAPSPPAPAGQVPEFRPPGDSVITPAPAFSRESATEPLAGRSSRPRHLMIAIVPLLVAAAVLYFLFWKKSAGPDAPASPAPVATAPATPAPVTESSPSGAASATSPPLTPAAAARAPVPEASAQPAPATASTVPPVPPPPLQPTTTSEATAIPAPGPAPAPIQSTVASTPAVPPTAPLQESPAAPQMTSQLPAVPPPPAPVSTSQSTSQMASGPMSDEAAEGPNSAPVPAQTVPGPPSTPPTSAEAAAPAEASAPEAHADQFEPDAILDECVVNQGFGSSFSSSRFESRFEGSTVEFSGTVARLNDAEDLVVFHGGGAYPKNWDLQLRRGSFSFQPDRRYRVVFVLRSVKAIPFGGFSFRGNVVSKTRD